MTRHCFAAAVLVVCMSAPAVAQAPVPVAERIVTHGETTTRVSLFSNRMVVVTISERGTQGFLRQISLPDDQFIIYLSILQDAAGELGERPVSSDVSTSHDAVELTLHIGPEAPRVLRFSPMAVVNLPLSKIIGALNDLEEQVRAASPSAAALDSWEPRRGDRVELMTGGFARVVEVLDEGVLILEHESTYLREVVPVDARDQVVLRVVDRKQ
ncbi:MAG TPA: hypothetical protein VLT81_04740 [Chondromyces sp.]|nr:hypothetical protein [Chondromyces sp.]